MTSSKPHVVIVESGYLAVEASRVLTDHGHEVTVLHRAQPLDAEAPKPPPLALWPDEVIAERIAPLVLPRDFLGRPKRKKARR